MMKIVFYLCLTVWLAVSVGGGAYLAQYENTPAESISAPAIFPTDSRLKTDDTATAPMLLFFAHPKCPCTRASLAELARLAAEVGGAEQLQIVIIFSKPAEANADWAETDLRRSAERIPNVRVVIDEQERETNLFNVETSGTALFYDRAGRLRFAGGMTAARGHEGDNVGRRAVREIIAEQREENIETDIFGCPIRQEDCPGQTIPQ